MSGITGTTNYMSSASIEGWMEMKTEAMYGALRGAMDTSNRRAEAEQALNEVKNQFLDAKNHGGDVTQAYAAMNSALEEYGDIPEVEKALGGIKNGPEYHKYLSDISAHNERIRDLERGLTEYYSPELEQQIKDLKAATVKATTSNDQLDTWNKSLGDVVDGLGKQDQMGMIQIQELNSQINQTKQIASALLDASDKSASSIINHIA